MPEESKAINDGGPAFPQSYRVPGHSTVVGASGLSLRDYFAAQAMQSLILIGTTQPKECKTADGKDTFDHPDCPYYFGWTPGEDLGNNNHIALGLDAYTIADVMLKARSQSHAQ